MYDSPQQIEAFQKEKGSNTEFSLTASHLLEYLFCPRFTYFEYVLDIPQHEERRFKVEVGRDASGESRRTRSVGRLEARLESHRAS